MPACLSQLYELRDMLQLGKGSEKNHRKMLQDPNFISLIDECEKQVALDPPHPKMEALLSILLSHFANAERSDNNEESDSATKSKVMVFVQYRQGVDEVLRHIKPHQEMLKASRFVGQSSDKKGEKGMSQKEQIEVCSTGLPAWLTID